MSTDTHTNHGSLYEELLCHFPYAIFSVCACLIILSLLSYNQTNGNFQGAYSLFHSFHFLHLIFAGTGVMITLRRYSANAISCFLLGLGIPVIFCTLSDAVLPYLGGRLWGLDMHFHWCFIAHIGTVLPFLIVGLINGWVITRHFSSNQLFYSALSHFFHIFVSSMASMMYLLSFGFTAWVENMGFVFLFLIVAVLAPCTLSDIVVPMMFTRKSRRKKGCCSCDGIAFCGTERSHDEKDSI